MGKFEKLFSEFFEIPEDEVHDDIKYQEIENWDSINHLNFVTKLEETYGIEFDMDEIIIDCYRYIYNNKKDISKRH